jgi:hypothetical protein
MAANKANCQQVWWFLFMVAIGACIHFWTLDLFTYLLSKVDLDLSYSILLVFGYSNITFDLLYNAS